jgi:hypothetical protein
MPGERVAQAVVLICLPGARSRASGFSKYSGNVKRSRPVFLLHAVRLLQQRASA